MAKNNTKLKKALSITVTVLAVLIFACAVAVFALTLYAKSNGKQAVLFGYSFSVVLSDSMTPEIGVGELVTVKHCPIEKAEVGDNAVYTAQSGPLAGQRIIHKIVEKGVDGAGNPYIITQGVKEGAPLDAPVYAEAFVGLGVAHSAFLGKVVLFFSKPINIVCLVVFLVGVCIGVHAIRKLVSYAKGDETEPNDQENPADPPEHGDGDQINGENSENAEHGGQTNIEKP